MRFIVMMVFSFLLVTGCSESPVGQARFKPVVGVDFVNAIPENDSVNILTFEYLYNGGGVGVGDFDRDGRPDLVFSGNLVSSALYLQQADWAFTDVTKAAGLTTDVWCAGVNIADVDGNGWDDVYFATLNPSGVNDTPNLLFLNQGTDENGVPIFREAAAEYGLGDPGYGTHSAWFDYENDGDLDLYVLNNAIENYNRNVAKGTDTSGRGKSVDRVYLKTSDSEMMPIVMGSPWDSGKKFYHPFPIKTEGWGLGVAIQDFNQDGYADIYVANDFLSNDFLLVNQRGEGFRDEIASRTTHQSRNAMGVDVADLTGDGHPEIMVVDMLPDDNLRRKAMFGDTPHQGHRMELERGYQPQFVRNTLQLNDGSGHFVEVGQQAGVAATDWSWTPLLADFDNDGDRDIFVSNGYPKDITDKDFIDFSDQSSRFGTRSEQLKTVIESLRQLGGVHQPNYFFRNDGELAFSRPGENWLPQTPSYSNGAVFVDLDGDGDLDLVTNNINEPAGIFRNETRERDTSTTNYLQLNLNGPAENPGGLGTKVWLTHAGKTIYHEHYRQRGYLSTVDAVAHFGLGESRVVNELKVRFPDGRSVVMHNVSANQLLEITWADDLPILPLPAASTPYEQAITTAGGPVHRESLYSDFDNEILAVRDHSRAGPALAALDLDGDGVDELVFGGAAGQPVTVWSINKGAWTQVQSLDETARSETVVLRVLKGDADTLLYVGNGSSEFGKQPELLADLVYILKNNRLELFPGTGAIPPLMTAAVVSINGPRDSNPYLFIGSRMRPGQYPMADSSVILSSAGEAYRMERRIDAGMVTAASAGDFNDDGYGDLVTAGEFEPIRIFSGSADGLGDPVVLPNTAGWYYSLTSVDLDGDGDLDLLAGNAGLNLPYSAGPGKPLTLLADDYDGNGDLDPILTAFNDGVAFPLAPRNTLTRQLPGLKRQIQNFATYGRWTIADLPPLTGRGIRLEATEMRTLFLRNDGAGNFTIIPLPAAAQTAPVRDAVSVTLADGRPALLVVQNDYAIEPLGGPYDGGKGFLLTVGANGELEVQTSYPNIRKDARSVIGLRDGRGGFSYFVGINNGKIRVPTLPPL